MSETAVVDKQAQPPAETTPPPEKTEAEIVQELVTNPVSRIMATGILANLDYLDSDRAEGIDPTDDKNKLTTAGLDNMQAICKAVGELSYENRKGIKGPKAWKEWTEGYENEKGQKVPGMLHYLDHYRNNRGQLSPDILEKRVMALEALSLLELTPVEGQEGAYMPKYTIEKYHKKYNFAGKPDFIGFITDLTKGLIINGKITDSFALKQRLIVARELAGNFGTTENKMDAMAQAVLESLVAVQLAKEGGLGDVVDEKIKTRITDPTERTILKALQDKLKSPFQTNTDREVDPGKEQPPIRSGEYVKIENKLFVVERVKGDRVYGTILNTNIDPIAHELKDWDEYINSIHNPTAEDSMNADMRAEAEKRVKKAETILQSYGCEHISESLVQLIRSHPEVPLEDLLPIEGKTFTKDGELHTIVRLEIDPENPPYYFASNGPTTALDMTIDKFNEWKRKAQPGTPDSVEQSQPIESPRHPGLIIDMAERTKEGSHGANEDKGWFDKEIGAAFVCDGVTNPKRDGKPGGGGELSSRIVHEAMRVAFLTMRPETLHTAQDAKSWLREQIRLANNEIRQALRNGKLPEGAGTTLTVAFIWSGPNGERELIFGNVGDSRLSMIRDGKLTDLTVDQSQTRFIVGERNARHVQELFGSINSPDELTPDYKNHWQQRSILFGAIDGRSDNDFIIKNLQGEDINFIEIGSLKLPTTGSIQFLLRSDGLTDVTKNDDTLRIMMQNKTLGAKAGDLIAQAEQDDKGARNKGRPDDKYAVAMSILIKQPQQADQSPELRAGAGDFSIYIKGHLPELQEKIEGHNGTLTELKRKLANHETTLNPNLARIISEVPDNELKELGVAKNDLQAIFASFSDGQQRSFLQKIKIITQLDITPDKEMATTGDGQTIRLSKDPKNPGKFISPLGRYEGENELRIFLPRIRQLHPNIETRRIASLWTFAHEFTHSILDITHMAQGVQGQKIQLPNNGEYTTTGNFLRDKIYSTLPQLPISPRTASLRNKDGALPTEPKDHFKAVEEEICETSTASIFGFAARPDFAPSKTIQDPFTDRKDFQQAVMQFVRAKPVYESSTRPTPPPKRPDATGVTVAATTDATPGAERTVEQQAAAWLATTPQLGDTNIPPEFLRDDEKEFRDLGKVVAATADRIKLIANQEYIAVASRNEKGILQREVIYDRMTSREYNIGEEREIFIRTFGIKTEDMKSGNLYLISNDENDRQKIKGEGIIGMDSFGRPNYIFFELDGISADTAIKIKKLLGEDALKTLDAIMYTTFSIQNPLQRLPSESTLIHSKLPEDRRIIDYIRNRTLGPRDSGIIYNPFRARQNQTPITLKIKDITSPSPSSVPSKAQPTQTASSYYPSVTSTQPPPARTNQPARAAAR